MFRLRDLECFLAVVEYRSFHAAARHLHMAQPPLSRRIASLERDLGGALFTRSTRNVELTEIGRVFAKEARSVLAQAELAHRIVQDIGRGFSGHVRVGYVASSGYTLLPLALKAFHKEFPRATVTLTEMLSSQQADALRYGTIDVGLHRGLSDLQGLEEHRIRSDGLIAALPEGHRLASEDVIPLKALADEDFVSLMGDHPDDIQHLVRSACAQAGFAPRLVQIVDTVAVVIACVAAGMGVALVNESARSLRWRVVFRDIDPPSPTFPFSVLTRADDGNPLVRAFTVQVIAAAKAQTKALA
jgi:DNA-binding transcriptional LysR family regulator